MLIVIIISSLLFIFFTWLFVRKVVIAKTNYNKYLKFESKLFKFSYKFDLDEQINLNIIYNNCEKPPTTYIKCYGYEFKNSNILIKWLKSFNNDQELAIYINDPIFNKNKNLNIKNYKRKQKLKNII